MYFVLQHTRGDMFLNSFGIGFSAFQGDGLTFPITAGEETDDWKLSYSLTGYETQSEELDITKAIQGKSALPQDVLTEMLEDTRQKVLSTSERITTLTAELNDGNSKIEEMKAEFNRIVSWSKIFDESPMEVKKMICGYIIKKVSVFRDYRVKIEFNINVEQFLNGIDSINECATYELPMAQ